MNRDEKIDKIRIALEKKHRKLINPIKYFEPLPIQKEFNECPAKVRGLFGGNRCLGGETKIYDPTIKKGIKVKDITSDFTVLAYDGYGFIETHATKPFIKGFDNLYEITLSSSQSFVASGRHQVLTSSGWRQLIDCHVGCSLYLPQTSLDTDPLTRVLNDKNYHRITQDYQCDCQNDSRFCDEQLLHSGDNDLNVFPSQLDVPKRTYGFCNIFHSLFFYFALFFQRKKDDLEDKLLHIHLQEPFHPSTRDDHFRNVDQSDDILYHVFYKLYKLVLNHVFLPFPIVLLSIFVFFLRVSMNVFYQLDRLFCKLFFLTLHTPPVSSTITPIITNVKYLRTDYIYDFIVPKYENFYADGAIHHNSGKTEDISAYVIQKCMEKPRQKWWAVAETFQDSVNIQQSKIWALLPKTEMTYCKYNEVLGFTNRKIIFSNGSSITFKSYDQGRESFQGDAVNGIWNDEEPPYDIYKEERMRLMDFDGEMILSMTSLKGMTDLMHDIYEDCEIVKSMKAPLLNNEIVPRIAKKDDIMLFFLWTQENKYINQKRVTQEAKHLTKDEIKSRIYGVPVGVAGRIYPMFNTDIHAIKLDNVPDRQMTIYHVLDPHDRKPWAMQWWGIHKTGTAYCLWEYPFNRDFNEMDSDDKTYDDYVKVIKETESHLVELFGRRVSKRIIDPNFGNATRKLAVRSGGQSHTTVKDELRKRGLNFQDGIDSLQTGHIQVKKWMYYEEKDNEMIIYPKMFIVDHCSNTKTHLSRYSYGDIETNSGDVKDKVKPKEKHKDFCDCARYFFMSDPKYISPQPQIPKSPERMY